jgi:protein PET100, fungi type
MYILFPIGWMYYFGINLENRFSVDNFWPSQEQSHQIPYEIEEIRSEVVRIAKETRERASRRKLDELKRGGGVMNREGVAEASGGSAGKRDGDGEGKSSVKS